MPSYPVEVRERILAQWDAGTPVAELSVQFQISTKTIKRYLALRESTGSLAPRSKGRKRLRGGAEQLAVLESIRQEDPGATLQQMADRLAEQTGVRVTPQAVGYWLRKLGAHYVRRRHSTRPQPRCSPSAPRRAYVESGVGASMPDRRAYPSDLTDAQWEWLEPLMPKGKPGGRHQEIPRRELVNAMLYVLRTGCPWRALPHDFPGWSTVHYYFRLWRISGLWEEIEGTLRERVRRRSGRQPTPSAAVMDSQSVSTTEKGGCVGLMATSA